MCMSATVAVGGCQCCCWTKSRNLIVFSLVWNFGPRWHRRLGCRPLGSRTDPRAASRQKASMTTRGRKAPLKYPGWWPCSNCNRLWLSPWLQCIVYRELCVTMLQFWGRQRLYFFLLFFGCFFFALFFKTGTWGSQTCRQNGAIDHAEIERQRPPRHLNGLPAAGRSRAQLGGGIPPPLLPPPPIPPATLGELRGSFLPVDGTGVCAPRRSLLAFRALLYL